MTDWFGRSRAGFHREHGCLAGVRRKNLRVSTWIGWIAGARAGSKHLR